MKKIKKIFAILLALTMVLGMGVTTFAEERTLTTGTITVSNLPTEGSKVYYRQIVKADPTVPLGWSSTDTNVITDDDLVKLIDGAEKNGEGIATPNANAIGKIINSSVDVAQIVNKVTFADSDTHVDATVTTATIPNVTPGLYAVVVRKEGYTYIPMLAYVAFNENRTGAVGNTILQAKGATNKVKKTITENTDTKYVTVSNTSTEKVLAVPFTVKVPYPTMDQTTTNRTFTIIDTVTNGTVPLEDSSLPFTVKIDGEVVTTGFTKAAQADEKEGFKVTFDPYDESKIGKEIEISYWVKANQNFPINSESAPANLSNEVELTFGDNGKTTKTESEVINPLVTATVKKVDLTDETITLSLAKFELYVVVPNNAAEATHMLQTNSNGNSIVTKPASPAESAKLLTKVTEKATGDDGTLQFTGLDAQKEYWIVETEAPNGYALNTAAYQLTGATYKAGESKEEKVGDVLKTTITNTATNFDECIVKDTKLSSLPSTGGIGTTIFTIGGCALMIVAAGLYFATRRKNAK